MYKGFRIANLYFCEKQICYLEFNMMKVLPLESKSRFPN